MRRLSSLHMTSILVLAALVIVLSGCSIRHGDFSVASNKIVRLSDFEVDKADRVKGVEGKDFKHIIFYIPTGIPTIDAAIDDALEKGNGDLLTDAVIEQYWWWFLVYGQVGWTVKGDVVKTRQN